MERARRPRTYGCESRDVRHSRDRIRRPARPLRKQPGRSTTLTAHQSNQKRRTALVVCGPTAAGKSDLADALAEGLSAVSGITTILIDSMQVYREIPILTNQARSRPAKLTGVVSVEEEWTVARHKESTEEIIGSISPDLPFVLDAGTGMYLNAIVLDIPLAPKAPSKVRMEAERLASGAENPRRETRRLELGLLGARDRGSIWDGPLRYDATFVYVRPSKHSLDRNIGTRSSGMVRDGLEEARSLAESASVPNASVREAIGVKEMLLHVSGSLTADEAEETIAARTRRLARRQLRWFDKLARKVPNASSRFIVLEHPNQNQNQKEIVHLMHDIMRR